MTYPTAPATDRGKTSALWHWVGWAGGLAGLAGLTSCGFSFNADVQDGNLIINAGYEISEKFLNQNSTSIEFGEGKDLLVKRVDRFEIQEGSIRAIGALVCPDRTEQPGSVDFALAAGGGSAQQQRLLDAKIVAVDSPCVRLDDARIVQVNQALAEAFTHMAQKNQDQKSDKSSEGKFEVTEVKVGDKKIKMSFKIVAPMESPSPGRSTPAPGQSSPLPSA